MMEGSLTNYQKTWRNREEDIEVARRISDEFGCGFLSSRVLVARGYRTYDAVYGFLHQSLRNLHDPFLFKDMEKAVDRIGRSLEKDGKIIIHGDYDADGITSTALMVRSLRPSFGNERISHHLPSRYGEGYGVSMQKVEEAAGNDIDLMITVDCGIKAFEAADTAREYGLDLIITDHHEPGDEIPNATAVIDPKSKDSGYPFSELAGVGVAFKLAHALQMKDVSLVDARELLDLVAFGTVADLVPLVDENRTLVKFGLEKLRDSRNMGLCSLMRESNIDRIKGPTATDISFKMAPRVNSAGRMGDPDMALELFLTEDRVDSDLFARQLNNLNFRRRSVGNKLVEEINAEIERTGVMKDPFILIAGKGWNPGVIGISANGVMNDLARPVAVLSIDDDGLAKGSARAPNGFDLIGAFSSVSDLLLEHGGHERAAGLTLRAEDIEKVREGLIKDTLERYPDLDFTPVIDIDLCLSPDELTGSEVEGLESLRPFGTANSSPIISIGDAMIGHGLTTVGEGKHLKFNIEESGSNIKCIYFNKGELIDSISPGSMVSIAGEPSIHRWGGRSDIQIRVIDMEYEPIS